MSIYNQVSQYMLDRCMPLCTFSKDAWLYNTEAVFLDEAGLSQICMRRCIQGLKEAGAASANAALGAGKQILEIASDETNSSVFYGLIAVTAAVATIGAIFLYTNERDKTRQ